MLRLIGGIGVSCSELGCVLGKLRDLEVLGGLHTIHEKKLLWNLARKTQSGVIVELGSFEGYSTIILAKAVGGRNHIYTIDPHTGRICQSDELDSSYYRDTWSKLNDNIQKAGVSRRVSRLKLKSEEAVKSWEEPIGLLFIDGSHYYKDAEKDLLFWVKFLAPRAVVVFHDMWLSGPRKVITDLVIRDRRFGEFRFIPCCMFCATYLGNNSRKISPAFVWLLLFNLCGVVKRSKTLKKWVRCIVRKL